MTETALFHALTTIKFVAVEIGSTIGFVSFVGMCTYLSVKGYLNAMVGLDRHAKKKLASRDQLGRQ